MDRASGRTTKVNEFVKRNFRDGTLHKSEWSHDECLKTLVTYTDPKTGYGYKYFEDEDLKGTPAIVQVSDLVQEGWEKRFSMKVVDNSDQPIID
jgi:hypothetical protein